MALTGAELEQIVEAILLAYDHERLAQMLRLRLDKRLDWITPDRDLKTVVFTLLVQAESEGWVGPLVEKAHEYVPGNKALAQAYREIIATEPDPRDPAVVTARNDAAAGLDPYSVALLRGRRAFIGRPDLRRQLATLARPPNPEDERVLVVHGERVSGRTYSHEMIAYLKESLRTFEFIYVDLKADATGEYGPADLVRTVALKMGRDLKELPGRDVPLRDQRDWILSEVTRSGKVWWFVFDSFDQVELSIPTRELVVDLAKAANTVCPPLRVVLLAYKENEILPPDLDDAILREKIATIGPADVRAFFQAQFQARGRGATPEQLDQIVNEVMAVVSADEPRYVEALGREVRRMYLSLFVGGPSQ